MSYRKLQQFGLDGRLNLEGVSGLSDADPRLLLLRCQEQLEQAFQHFNDGLQRLERDPLTNEKVKIVEQSKLFEKAQQELSAAQESWEFKKLGRELERLQYERDQPIRELQDLNPALAIEARSLLRSFDNLAKFAALQEAVESDDRVTLGALATGRSYDRILDRKMLDDALSRWAQKQNPEIAQAAATVEELHRQAGFNLEETQSAIEEKRPNAGEVAEAERVVEQFQAAAR